MESGACVGVWGVVVCVGDSGWVDDLRMSDQPTLYVIQDGGYRLWEPAGSGYKVFGGIVEVVRCEHGNIDPHWQCPKGVHNDTDCYECPGSPTLAETDGPAPCFEGCQLMGPHRGSCEIDEHLDEDWGDIGE